MSRIASPRSPRAISARAIARIASESAGSAATYFLSSLIDSDWARRSSSQRIRIVSTSGRSSGAAWSNAFQMTA